MKRTWVGIVALIALLPLAMLWAGQSAAQTSEGDTPLTGAFTYQGRLSDNGNVVDDSCDLRFTLWDGASSGSPIGAVQTVSNVTVADGLFTVVLNGSSEFGPTPFDGTQRFLGIEVRCPAGSGSYTLLSPRQALTATPFAQYSSTSVWGGLLGIPSGFSDNVDNDTTYSAGNGLSLDSTTFNVIGSPIENIIVVAKSGGDYTTITNALNNISDASESNRYQIFVGPGVYTERVLLKDYIDLVGSGVNTTKIVFPTSGGLSTIRAGDFSEIRDLTVENNGTGSNNFAIAIEISGDTVRITNVVAHSTNGLFNYSIYAASGSNVTLRNVRSTAVDGNAAIALYLFSSNGVVYDSFFDGEDATNGQGIYTTGSTANNYTLAIINSVVQGTNGIIRRSIPYDIRIANSQLGGGGTITNPDGTIACVASRNDDFGELTGACGNIVQAPLSGLALSLQCGSDESAITRSNTPHLTDAFVVTAGEAAGSCVLETGRSLTDAIWSVNAASADARLVGCEQVGETQLQCGVATPAGDPINGVIQLIFH